MTETSNELMYGVLKQVQEGQARILGTLADHSEQLIGIRDDIHGVRGDILRLERGIVETKVRLERIERRMGLVEV